jgi:hypothetical protein
MTRSPQHPFPTAVQRPKAQVERAFYRLSDTRCGDASYHFTIVLPHEWRPLDTPVVAPTDAGTFVTLGIYRATADVTAEVEVHAVLLEREVAPAHWLELYLANAGAEILARRDIDTEGGLVADILARTVSPEGPLVTRWLAMKNYNRLFVLEGRALEPDYAREAESIFIALTSVNLLRPIDWPLAERLKTFSRKEPGDFLIMFPESWELVEAPTNNERALQVTLKQWIGPDVVATIVFATVARAAESDPQKLADRYADDLRHGLVLLDALPLVPADPRPGFEKTFQCTAPATVRRIPGECRVWAGVRPDALFFVGLHTPSRAGQAEVWAVATRAFDIVLRYLKVA